MAPARGGGKRVSIRSKKSARPSSSTSITVVTAGISKTKTRPVAATKRLKRIAKHTSFVAKISKPSTATTTALRPAAGNNSKNKIIKRRSRGRARRGAASGPLLDTLQSLVDALPECNTTTATTTTAAAAAERDTPAGLGLGQAGATIFRKKSLRSRPGALKRMEKVVRVERERFNRNLAQMAGGTTTAATVGKEEEGGGGEGGAGAAASPVATSTRWAALRGFVSQTLERKEEFCS